MDNTSVLRNILMIGGAGYVGLHVTRNLVNSGYSPIILTPNPEKVSNLDFMRDVELIRGSVTDSYLVRKLVRDKTVVINMAGFIDKENKDSKRSLEINCLGEINVLESLREENPNAHHIFFGTRAQFGKINRNGELIGEEQRQEPISLYGINKKTCEDYLRCYNKMYGLKISSLRLVGIYGPAIIGEPRHFVSGLIKRGLEGRDLIINGDGFQIQDFIYVEDVSSLVERIIEKRVGGVYNIGSGRGLSMRRVADMIKSKCGSKGRIVYRKLSLEEGYGDLDGSIMDISKIKAETGWEPKVELSEGIDRTIEWFRRNGD